MKAERTSGLESSQTQLGSPGPLHRLPGVSLPGCSPYRLEPGVCLGPQHVGGTDGEEGL